MTWILMAYNRPWLIRLVFESLGNSYDCSRKQIINGDVCVCVWGGGGGGGCGGGIFLLLWKCMLCVLVLIRIAPSRYIQHTIIIEDWKDSPKSFPFASWLGAMINPQWLKLPISRRISTVLKIFELLKFDYITKFLIRLYDIIVWSGSLLFA